MSIKTISPSQFAELNRSGKTALIDVRTPAEFREVHVENARNVPLDQLDPVGLMTARNGAASEPLYLICKGGARSAKACEEFIKAGFENVISIEGGTSACIAAGLARCPRQEDDLAGAAGAHRRRVASACGRGWFILVFSR